MTSPKPFIYPAILSGGSGTRLWPLSRAVYPKQFQKIAGDNTLLQSTAIRVSNEFFAAPVVVCNEEHRFIVAEQLRAIHTTPNSILLEPVGRNTAAATTIAALWVQNHDPDGLVLILPSDHLIDDEEQFCDQILALSDDALSGNIVTFGIAPTDPDPEFNYIRALDREDPGFSTAKNVDSFFEKPGADIARKLIQEGFSWHSGISLFRPHIFLAAMAEYASETLSLCKSAWEERSDDLEFTRLAAEPYRKIKPSSADKTVLEKYRKTILSPLATNWQDLRTWNSVWQTGRKDDSGNTFMSDAISIDSHNSFVHADRHLTTIIGLDDVSVIASDDAVLVSSMRSASDVDKIVHKLEGRGSSKHRLHTTVYRPWGSFHSVLTSSNFQVKELIVNPGASLSLQKHQYRAEHWVIVSGTASVIRGEDALLLHENQSVYIPLGTVHRLANPGKIPLHVIEVQSGTYLGEDDIIRYEDTYGRNNSMQ